jgi:adenine-specific DNA-methyltransferase
VSYSDGTVLSTTPKPPGTLKKRLGAFYTPTDVASALVRWVVRKPSDRLLDPACGDGRFLAAHRNSVGVECDVAGVVAATKRTRFSMIHAAEFFSWAESCQERFECAAGNPPFIRYQHFVGAERHRALRLAARLGANFSGLTSSWAPFLAVTAGLLKPNGRMAFLVPAEVGHAPYAQPLVAFLARNFARVMFVAVRTKLFPELSEDVWILYAEGFGNQTERIHFARTDSFDCGAERPKKCESIPLAEWEAWNFRLRPFLLSSQTRELYQTIQRSETSVRFGKLARIGIGYVTGANDFFHLRPTMARDLRIPDRYLIPSVRNGRWLDGNVLTARTVQGWKQRDEPVLLLRLPKDKPIEKSVQHYLDSLKGAEARMAFKCRSRKPWYAVPDVRIPDAFLSYMSGQGPRLVANEAGCACTNSIHAVSLTNGCELASLHRMWDHPLTRLSCEIEGHPLGGGMLKLEPGECSRILLPMPKLEISPAESSLIQDGIQTMRRWRHYE